MDGVLGGRCYQHGRSGVKSPLGLASAVFLAHALNLLWLLNIQTPVLFDNKIAPSKECFWDC
ncbi:hypothetical protein HBZC1_07930 [Helicobacter bizzozeronii CIII-1]|uniref:Uncharacterized protein n=1 Tax=Helicobacter bizzozeronii (strain CIII-1) TaxID=1002804 RepID=F8KQ52_HELBC|nr:hypothetical protein HBZC1_07930 [Helicobacter bizzozeronii CIII-1]